MTAIVLCGMQIMFHPWVQTHSPHVVSAEQQKFAPFLTTNILEFYHC